MPNDTAVPSVSTPPGRLPARRLRDLALHQQQAQEQERSRIARELHDRLGQALTGLKLEMLRLSRLLDGAGTDVGAQLRTLTAGVDELIRDVQTIATELRPALLDDLGFAAACRWQVRQFRQRSGLRCDCRLADDAGGLDDAGAIALFRILQEALTNVARHANASRVVVAFGVDDGWATLSVDDDGSDGARVHRRNTAALGILGMQERARELGGEVTVTARNRGGVRVLARVPAGTAPPQDPAH